MLDLSVFAPLFSFLGPWGTLLAGVVLMYLGKNIKLPSLPSLPTPPPSPAPTPDPVPAPLPSSSHPLLDLILKLLSLKQVGVTAGEAELLNSVVKDLPVKK